MDVSLNTLGYPSEEIGFPLQGIKCYDVPNISGIGTQHNLNDKETTP